MGLLWVLLAWGMWGALLAIVALPWLEQRRRRMQKQNRPMADEPEQPLQLIRVPAAKDVQSAHPLCPHW